MVWRLRDEFAPLSIRPESLTFLPASLILWPMKRAVYLTDPEAMRKARLQQPRVTSEQARAQLEQFRRASEKFSEDAKSATSSRGREKTAH